MGRERTGKRTFVRMADLNMTPLIDLTFLLLITFIITFPMLEQGITVRLPHGKADKIEQAKSQSISIKYNGEIFLNNSAIAQADLESKIKAISQQDPQPPVLVRCDERVEYGVLVKTLRVLNAYKISRMALVTEPVE